MAGALESVTALGGTVIHVGELELRVSTGIHGPDGRSI
jgi:hypothetical protein